MAEAKIGIIGGSGLYKMEALQDVEELQVDTPFGAPSDALIVGTLEGTRVAFLARHGRNHTLLPSELPFRANIHAMKQLGVEYIISASAVGSLKEEAKPLDMVVPDQFIDRTKSHVLKNSFNLVNTATINAKIAVYPNPLKKPINGSLPVNCTIRVSHPVKTRTGHTILANPA